jgi:hypothetical protein
MRARRPNPPRPAALLAGRSMILAGGCGRRHHAAPSAGSQAACQHSAPRWRRTSRGIERRSEHDSRGRCGRGITRRHRQHAVPGCEHPARRSAEHPRHRAPVGARASPVVGADARTRRGSPPTAPRGAACRLRWGALRRHRSPVGAWSAWPLRQAASRDVIGGTPCGVRRPASGTSAQAAGIGWSEAASAEGRSRSDASARA